MTAVVGVAESGNAAVLVTVGPDAAILDRRRVALSEPGLPSHPIHHQGSWAVGRYLNTPGAHPIPLSEVVALVERVRAAARRRAHQVLADLASEHPIGAIALRAYAPLPPTVEAQIRDARAQTWADTAMYRDALASAAEARGWRVAWYERAVVLASPGVDTWLRAVGRRVGPPWQAAHKLAAAAAWGVASR
jgi:hypothetical protein